MTTFASVASLRFSDAADANASGDGDDGELRGDMSAEKNEVNAKIADQADVQISKSMEPCGPRLPFVSPTRDFELSTLVLAGKRGKAYP